MSKKWAAFLLAALCGCAAKPQSRAFEPQPFTAQAEVIWQGEEYTAAVCYGPNGALALSMLGGALTEPVRLSYSDGVQEVEMGKLSLRLPIEDALPGAVGVEFLSALTRLRLAKASQPKEDGSFFYEEGSCSIVVEENGAWRTLFLEGGRFDFSEFTLTQPGT